jgi:hypothetical protein
MKTSKELIQELADQGLTQAQIAKKLNCSRENIRRQCNRYNIVIKKRGKSKVQNWYLKYENTIFNNWRLLDFVRLDNSNNKIFNAICLSCNNTYQVKLNGIIYNNSKFCRSCFYKKSTQQNYTILNTINWSYESTKTN